MALPPRSSVVVPWAVAAVLALAAVTLAVLLLATHEDDPVGSSAESSAAAACDVLDDLPDSVDLDDGDAVGALQARLASARSLAMLAESQDGSYGGLRKAMDRMHGAFAAEFSIDGDTFHEARGDAEDRCDDVG